ncbi:hypothetical protein LX36DRAFT_531398, partial [Colletotrichum falcatum]
VILRPGQAASFNSGTLHLIYRASYKQTLALGGHILQWSPIDQWLRVVILDGQQP